MKAARETGFTLLEVLVATALLALLGLALLGLVRTTASLSADVGERFVEAAHLRTARGLLADRLVRALPVTFPSADGSGLAFDGGPRVLRFLAAEPPYGRFPGLAAWEFALEEVAEGTLVKVRVAPAPATGDPLRALAESDWRPVARIAARLRFTYLTAAEPGAGGWMADWRERTDLPRAVRVTGENHARWPPLIVPLRIPELGGCAGIGTGAAACPS